MSVAMEKCVAEERNGEKLDCQWRWKIISVIEWSNDLMEGNFLAKLIEGKGTQKPESRRLL